MAQMVKNLPAMQETGVQSLGWDDPLEKRMAIHFSILAWRIPRTEEPGQLQLMGCKESDTTERLTPTYTMKGKVSASGLRVLGVLFISMLKQYTFLYV